MATDAELLRRINYLEAKVQELSKKTTAVGATVQVMSKAIMSAPAYAPSYVVGNLLYASGPTSLASLASVALGQVLVSAGVGVAPAWSGAPTLTTSLKVPIIIAPAASLILKPTADGSTAIQLCDKDGNVILNVDSINNYIGIRIASPEHPLHLLGAGYLTGGLYIGVNSTDNLIDDASNGAGSATLYIGNEAIITTSGIAALAGVYVNISGDTMTGTLILDDDNISIIWGAGQDAGISYDGTNLIINPKLVGSGYVNVKGQILVDDKIMFTQTDGNEYIDSLADGYLDLGATIAIRLKNPTLCEDKLYFTQIDGNEYIDSLADGYLDLGATTAIRLSSPITRVTGDLYIGADADVDPAIVMTGDSNDGQITWNEDENKFSFNAILNLPLAVYANNAAALAGGLVAGDLYRTGGDPDPVCIVH